VEDLYISRFKDSIKTSFALENELSANLAAITEQYQEQNDKDGMVGILCQ
jgi:hypothetical protein